MSAAPAPSERRYTEFVGDRDRPRRNRRRRGGGRAGLRTLYFSVASVWGCVLGAAGVALAVTRAGIRPGLDGTMLAMLGGAGILSIAGGALASRAYREAAQRRRR